MHPESEGTVPTPEHQIVKPEVIAKTAAVALEDSLVIPNTFQKESVDQYKGKKNDTINVPVEGVLPFHEYEWRNDRSQPIVTDVYEETTVPVSFEGNFYSAVKVTDENFEFDIIQWAKLIGPQSKAVARGIGRQACNKLETAAYNVVIGDALADLRGALIEARRVLNKLHAPEGDRYMLVGTNFESALLATPDLALAQNIGDPEAGNMLVNATIGQRYGFKIVVDQTIAPDAAYAYSGSGFIWANAAPTVPGSVPLGGTASYEGVAMRWMRDYDSQYLQDRSVVNTYSGMRPVLDTLVGWDPTANGGLGKEIVSDSQYFVRGIKLLLDGASVYPTAGSELANVTGLSTPGSHLKGAAATKAND